MLITMQKVYKRKVPKVYKNKKLNNANFGTYNLNDYQGFLLLVSKLGKTNADGTYKQDDVLERTITITAKEFSEVYGVEVDGAYTTLKRIAKKLTETSITLEKPELFETWHIALCAEAKYNHKEGSITAEFTPNILPYLKQVKQKFVLYNLKEVANFGSLYSTRLYELIQEFKDTGWLVKSIAQLREVFAVGKKFVKYNDFKTRTFAHAVDEINSQYPTMKLRFEEIKEGRKVVSIDFRFTPSTIIEQYNPVTRQIVSVTSKPKQTTVAKIRKPKKDDENTPPPVPTDQQELPNINYSETYKERTHEEIQAIINLLMKENNLTYVEAVTRAIKYKLI
ncbi:MAG: replication initiator protein [Bacteroidota bacterium]|jgi:plasmid replication initiation protein